MTREERIEKLSQVDQFTGGGDQYRHALRVLTYTEGAKYVADVAGAYWLLDIIASVQPLKCVRAEAFQVWRLVVNPDRSARITADDGNGHAIYTQAIPYTDFPLATFVLWCTDGVILLPSEY